MDTLKRLQGFAADIVDWVVLMFRQWLAIMFGLVATAVVFYWEHKNGKSIDFDLAMKIAGAAFYLAAFLAWRSERKRYRSLRSMMNAMQIPDFSDSVIPYVWISRLTGSVGVLAEVHLINLGEASKASDWHLNLNLSDGSRSGMIEAVPVEVSRHTKLTRLLFDMRNVSRSVVTRAGAKGYLWATFDGVSFDDADAATVTVGFRDDRGKSYTVRPDFKARTLARLARGRPKPYT